MSYLIGLTGGIASGKSTVSAWFKEAGITVIDADQIAHLLMAPKEKNWQLIVENFGQEILNPDQTIDRQKLGKIVFNDSKKLTQLNQLVQPAIHEKILQKIVSYTNEPVVVLDIPLLFEQNYQELVDQIVVVFVDEKTQIDRLKERNNLTQEEALAKINAQMPLSEKKNRADVVIDNSDTIVKTRTQVDQLLSSLPKL